MIDGMYLVGFTSSRELDMNRNEITRIKDGNIVYKWKGYAFVVHIIEDHLIILEDSFTGELIGIEMESGKEKWRFAFNDSYPGRRYYQPISDILIVAIEMYNTSHPVIKSYSLLGII